MKLLLREILKHTGTGTEEHDKLSSALAMVKDINDFINQRKKEDDMRRKIIEIQNNIIAKDMCLVSNYE